MKITSPVFSRFFSLGCSISRLTWARVSSPLMASTECPKPTKRMIQVMLTEPGAVQPAQRFFVQRNHARDAAGWAATAMGARKTVMVHQISRITTITVVIDHDLQRFLAGLVHALRILPPEISHHDHGQAGGEVVVGKMQRAVHVHAHVFDEAREVLAGGDGADGAGQDVVEEQGRDGELGQRAAHGLLDHAVDAAAHEHAARFDVERPHGIAEQHDREDEPGSALADDLFGVAAGVVSGGCEVGENDGGGPPEGDEGQHHRGGDEDLYGRFGTFNGCSHASRSAEQPIE